MFSASQEPNLGTATACPCNHAREQLQSISNNGYKEGSVSMHVA
jgi:hypothetical protein